jgi:minor extracellular serine protease Vpr
MKIILLSIWEVFMRFMKIKAFLLILIFIFGCISFQTKIKAASGLKIDLQFFESIKNSSNLVSVIVQFKEDCIVDYTSRNQIFIKSTEPEYFSFLEKQQKDWIEDTLSLFPFSVDHSYQHVLNGISIQLRGYNIRFLLNDPRIERISNTNIKYYINRQFSSYTLCASKSWSLQDVNNQSITGKGIRVGILDTGIDYNHPDFAVGSGKSKKIKGGKDFADNDNDFYDNGSTFRSGFPPHGTHVAGITAGNNISNSIRKGMAPDADLYIYKIFSNNSSGADPSDIIAAINQSVIDKCHVINMSIGNPYPIESIDQTSPYYLAVQNATKAGVVVVCGAGNDGSRSVSQKFVIASPGIFEPAIQVAGSDDRMNVFFQLKLPDGSFQRMNCPKFFYTPPFPYQGSPIDIIDCGFGMPTDFDGIDVKGKIALVSRGPKSGGLPFKDKNLNAKKAGALGIITYNYDEEVMENATLVTETEDPKKLNFIPNMSMSGINATILKNALQKGAKLVFPKESNITLYDMSSAGPCLSGDDNIFKPEVSSPGKQINSAVMSTDKNKKKIENPYEDWDGTSMATPGVTGVVALVRQAHPTWNTYDVKAVLMNTADIIMNQICDIPYSFLNQGSGQVNAISAIEAPVITTPPSFMRNIDKAKKDNTFELKNVSVNTVLSHLSFEIFGESEETNPIEAVFSENEITLQKSESKTFNISFKIDQKKVIQNRYEGAIWIQTNQAKHHIPIILYKGKISDIEKPISAFTLTSPDVNINNTIPTTIKFQLNAGSKFLVTGITPSFEQISNCAKTFNVFVLDNKKNIVGTIFYAENLFAGSYEIPWNGKDIYGKEFLPNGKYFLKAEMSGLKYVVEDGKIKDQVQVPDFSELKPFTILESNLPTPPLLIVGSPDKISLNSEFILDIIFADTKDVSEIDLKVTFSKAATSIISYNLGEFVDMTKLNVKRDVEFSDGYFTLSAKRDLSMNKSRLRVATLRIKADSTTSKAGLLAIVDFISATNKAGDDIKINSEFPLIQIVKTSFKYGDFNKDGKINNIDLDLLMAENFKTYTDPDWNSKFDLNNDLLIDLGDLAIFSRYYVNE